MGVLFLSDRNVVCLAVRLSVCPSVCDEVHCGQTNETIHLQQSPRTSQYELLVSAFLDTQLTTPYTDHIILPLEPQTLVPSGEYIIKTYREQAIHRHFHVWNSHRQHATWQFTADNAARSTHSQKQLGYMFSASW